MTSDCRKRMANLTTLTAWDVLGMNDTAAINESLLPYQNWTVNEYSMPHMPKWIPISYLTLLCVTIGVGIPGNLITALAYFYVKVKNNCDWYIFFVAVFDLISCTFRVTEYLLEFMGVWAQLTSTNYCRFVSWISQTSVGMSIFIVGLIAIDRCIKVSFNSRLTISPVQSRNICLIFTVVAFFLGLPCLFIYANTPRGICIVTRESVGKRWVQSYYSTIFLLLFLMMAAVIFCYLTIAWTVMKNRRVIHIMPAYSTTQRQSVPRPIKKIRRQKQTTRVDFVEERGIEQVPTSPHQHHREEVSVVECTSNNKGVSDNGRSSSGIKTMSIPQAPRLFIIPGPQTKALFIPQPYRNNKTINTNTNVIVGNDGSCSATAGTSKGFVATEAANHAVVTDDVEETELSLEKATAMKTRSSDESVRRRIRFSKEQWNKRLARDYKVTGLLFLVTTMFILSWIAPTYATFRAFFVGITFPFTVEDAAFLIYAPNTYIINNFINPLIYLVLSGTYRKRVKDFFKQCANFISRLQLC